MIKCKYLLKLDPFEKRRLFASVYLLLPYLTLIFRFCWLFFRISTVPPEHSSQVAVGDGQPHHGQHVGQHEEDELVDVVQQWFRGITIWPNHQTGSSWLFNIVAIADSGGVEEGGDRNEDADGPDDSEEYWSSLDGEVRSPRSSNGHIPSNTMLWFCGFLKFYLSIAMAAIVSTDAMMDMWVMKLVTLQK